MTRARMSQVRLTQAAFFFHRETRQFAAGRRQADFVVSMCLERFFSESSREFRLRRLFFSHDLGVVLVRAWELAR